MQNGSKLSLAGTLQGKLSQSRLTAYLVPFTVLTGYLVYLVLSERFTPPGEYYLIHYLYTYDHGFIARGLVGQILSLFFDILTPDILKTVLLVLSELLIIASSLCMGYALNKTRGDAQRHNTVLLIIIILCIMPITYRSFLLDYKLDKILWTITFFAVLLSERKYGIWLCVPLCLIAVLVNPVFLFCSMILIAIILLQKCRESCFAPKNIAVCLSAYVPMLVIGPLSVASEKLLGFKDGIELVYYYFSRYSVPLERSEAEWFARVCLFDYFEPFGEAMKTAYRIYGIEYGQLKCSIFNFIFLALPFFVLLILFWRAVIKAESDRFGKFIFFLCAVSPVVTIPPIAFSWEASKYFGNNIIVQLCLIVFFVVHNNASVVAACKKLFVYCRSHWLTASLITVYFSFFSISLTL